jgi:hypothetical protein
LSVDLACVIVTYGPGSIWWSSGIPAAARPLHDPELASYLRIEERELEAGGRN